MWEVLKPPPPFFAKRLGVLGRSAQNWCEGPRTVLGRVPRRSWATVPGRSWGRSWTTAVNEPWAKNWCSEGPGTVWEGPGTVLGNWARFVPNGPRVSNQCQKLLPKYPPKKVTQKLKFSGPSPDGPGTVRERGMTKTQ